MRFSLRFLLIHESPLTDALFLLVSKSDEVTNDVGGSCTVRTRIWHSDWKPRWLIRCVSAALLSFMDKQVTFWLRRIVRLRTR